MPLTPILLKTKDNAQGRLNAGISASDLTIVLQAGQGALFPQPYTGSASSLGSGTVLNDTGDLGGLVAGDFVRNVTDGSWAFVITPGASSVTTTQLQGGSDNTWQSSDVWRANEFVITLADVTTNAYGVPTVNAREQALVSNRSTDTLTVPSGGRGFNSTTAQAWDASDYVYLNVTSVTIEEMKELLAELARVESTNITNIATNTTDITAQKTGSYHYVVATGSSSAYVAATPALAAYAAGNIVRFKANHTNTGAATLNVNGLGAIDIKKNDGVTALAANDIISGQIVEVVYEATTGDFQMTTPVGTPATVTYYNKVVYIGHTASTTVGASSTSEVNYDTHTYNVPANDLVNGVAYRFQAFIRVSAELGTPAITFAVKLGTTQLQTFAIQPYADDQDCWLEGTIFGTAAAGASVAVKCVTKYIMANGTIDTAAPTGPEILSNSIGSANVATNAQQTFQLSAQWDTSHANNNSTLNGLVLEKISTTPFA